MPYKTLWVKPETFLTHKGQRVYHVYKDDEIDQGRRSYTYALDPHEHDHDGGFDARDLSPYKNLEQGANESEHDFLKRCIRLALTTGELYLDNEISAIKPPTTAPVAS